MPNFLRVYPDSDIKVLEQRLTNYEIEQDSHKWLRSTPIALLSTLRSTHPREDVNVKLNHVRLLPVWVLWLLFVDCATI